MNTDTRKQIETALSAFSGSDLRTASIGLLNSLGYQSEKTLDIDNTPVAFRAEFDKRDREFRTDKALFERWKSVEFLFQITDDEVRAGAQGTLFDSGFNSGNYQSYLFFALDLEKYHYTRTHLADITREINLLFDMPAMLLMRHNGALTFSVIDRRLHKKDQGRDVLEKVKLIKDIRYQDPHRAHIEILHDLALQSLMAKHECRDFKQLHEAWRTTLDTNELNKKFYRELADWYFWALDHVEFPADVEKEEATRNATNVIRLLTRLIFCWFLKEKGLIPASLFNERKLADVLKSLKDDDSTFYQAILQNLFFGTLNQRMNTRAQENRKFTNAGPFLERKDEYGVKNLYRYQKLFAIAEEEAVNLFSDIPFMNGGLFDCLDKEDDSGKVIYVDGFTRNVRKQPKVPNFLFFSDYRTLDLSDAYGDKKRKKEKVRGLINLLDSYKFTVTENTPIEEEIALDPELLGKVFENLLASYNPETGTSARKQTGSFYTPREIVHYMVDESLIAYLEGQLKAKVPKLAEMKDLQNLLREVLAYTEKVHPFDEEEVEALIDAIDTCKILDPACGSGAFPMGILHKLVFILGKIDPHNERWKQKQIARAEQIPDVSAREVAVSAIEKDFETNDLDYGRKLYLIENCIYGVDIQPIAIQISKLRFFISLICDQRTNKNKDQNRGVRPLPNLETKFVAANTLIYLDRGKGQQLSLTAPRLSKLESELAAVRHRHFAVQRRRDKLALQRRDAKIREEISGILAGGGMSGKASHRLAAWNPYDQNASAPFFDSEWMYGIIGGFHVIIGNPPYIQSRSGLITEAEKSYYISEYQTTAYQLNTSTLFMEQGLRLLHDAGLLCMIVPNYWLATDSDAKLRSYLFLTNRVLQVVNTYNVFDGATVDTLVALVRKGAPRDVYHVVVRSVDKALPSISGRLQAFVTGRWVADLSQRIAVDQPDVRVSFRSKLDLRQPTCLGHYFVFKFGMKPYEKGKGVPPQTREMMKGKVYHASTQMDATYKRLLGARDVKKLVLHWCGFWIKYGENLAAPRKEALFSGQRILLRRIVSRQGLDAVFTKEYFVNNTDVIIMRPRAELSEDDMFFFLGLLVSNTVHAYVMGCNVNLDRATFPKVNTNTLETLPVPELKTVKQTRRREYSALIQEVRGALQKGRTKLDGVARAHDKHINSYSYSLYGLTVDEIALVEGMSV